MVTPMTLKPRFQESPPWSRSDIIALLTLMTILLGGGMWAGSIETKVSDLVDVQKSQGIELQKQISDLRSDLTAYMEKH
jgi:hypothetical protein